jgi:hypothetical protein
MHVCIIHIFNCKIDPNNVEDRVVVSFPFLSLFLTLIFNLPYNQPSSSTARFFSLHMHAYKYTKTTTQPYKTYFAPKKRDMYRELAT